MEGVLYNKIMIDYLHNNQWTIKKPNQLIMLIARPRCDNHRITSQALCIYVPCQEHGYGCDAHYEKDCSIPLNICILSEPSGDKSQSILPITKNNRKHIAN